MQCNTIQDNSIRMYNTMQYETPQLRYDTKQYLHLSVANGIVSSKIYYKRDDFDFDIVFSVFRW